MTRHPGRRTFLLLPLLVAGCKLVDQRTFDPTAGRAPPAPVATVPAPPPPAPSGPTPLVVIPLPAVAYEGPLHQAVALALERGRRQFEVRASVPATGTPDAQGTAVNDASGVAARVAELIAVQGGRATLTAEAAAGRAGSAVLVFVR